VTSSGFLVYTVFITAGNNTSYSIVVDPGTGQILSTSQVIEMGDMFSPLFQPEAIVPPIAQTHPVPSNKP